MANKNVFSNVVTAPAHDTVNNAGGAAYSKSPKEILAQIAATNCFNDTYSSAQDNLEQAKQAILNLVNDPTFVAKVAIYSRDKGYMKDMPAFICVMLANIDKDLFNIVFDKVINNGKMLSNFAQIARSGATGRKYNLSAGTIRKAINRWFLNRTPEQIFRASIGNNPSMADILKMARPKPKNAEYAALFAYILDKEVKNKKFVTLDSQGEIVRSAKYSDLPKFIKDYEKFKIDRKGKVPNVDFRFLDSLNLTDNEWKQVAQNANYQMTRMNLNTFSRHNVFDDKEIVDLVASRLSDKEELTKAKQFPYQLMTAYMNVNDDMPRKIVDALHDATEYAVDNIPDFDGDIYIAVDSSGSMTQPITGYRTGGVSSKITCNQVASLIAASILRKNKGNTYVYTFDTACYKVNLEPRDTILTNAKKLHRNGGGTRCSVVFEELDRIKAKGDLVIMISDNESWFGGYYSAEQGWLDFKKRNSKAKLINIDLVPNRTSQLSKRQDVLQVGGFSDEVYGVIKNFVSGNKSSDWMKEIENIQLN
jgi:60 kDa SS-A/Ro ribonucleoprotein